MRLRRKDVGASNDVTTDATVDAAETPTGSDSIGGPFDAEDVHGDGIERLDLGAILVAPSADHELRVQVDEQSGVVRAVLLATDAGAVELRAFAAPRNGDLWSDIRPQIAADAARRGGTATEREGRFGTELVCEVQMTREDGAVGTQTSRVIGINGSRWLLRATLLGEPAREPETAQAWEDAIARVAVRRGANAMPVGEQLPLSLPDGATPRAVEAG